MRSKSNKQKRSTGRTKPARGGGPRGDRDGPRVMAARANSKAGDSPRSPTTAEIERCGAESVGAFTAADGEHRCFLAFAGEEALLYDLPPHGSALCLAWVGGALGDARAEADAVFTDYAKRTAGERRALCRAVRVDEVERLQSAQQRAA